MDQAYYCPVLRGAGQNSPKQSVHSLGTASPSTMTDVHYGTVPAAYGSNDGDLPWDAAGLAPGSPMSGGGPVRRRSPQDPLPTTLGVRFDLWNLGWLSASFFLLFSAYNTIQNFVTSLLPGDLGNTSLTVLYSSVAVTVFSAPMLVDRMGEKWALVLGSACYFVYIASLIHIIPGVVIAASVVTGFGAAVLWVAFGVYIAKLGKLGSGEGTSVGVFWSIFQLSNVGGNLCAYLVFDDVSNSPWFYVVFVVIAVAAVLVFMFLGRIPPSHDFREVEDYQIGEESRRLSVSSEADLDIITRPRAPGVLESLQNTLSMVKEPRILLLMPMFFWTGFELAAWTGAFPELLKHKEIGLVMIFSGVGEVVSGGVMGRISDKLGWTFSTLFGFIIYAAALVMTAFLQQWDGETVVAAVGGAPLLAFLAALCYGGADSTFNTVTYGVLSDMLSDSHSFTVFQLVQNIGSAVGFYYATAVPLKGEGGSLTQIYVQAAIMVVSTLCFLVAVRRYAAGTAKSRQERRGSTAAERLL